MISSLRHERPIHRQRLHYLDWLRVLSVLGVFYAHTTDIFDRFYWHVRGGDQQAGLMVLVVFGTEWGMALFFFLAGTSAWFALQSRTPRQFISERFKRLIIPCIVGVILFSPPQAYLLAISHGLYSGSLFQFYPFFFESIHPDWWNPQWIGTYSFHLWFLADLFFIALVALPVLLLLKRKQGLHFISRLVAVCTKPGGLFVFGIPVALVQVALRAPFPGYQGWSDVFTWLLIFLYGFMLLADPRFELALHKQWKLILAVSIASSLIMLGASFTGALTSWDALSDYSAGYVSYQLLRSIVIWSWMLFALYFGLRVLDFSSKFIDYADEAILPFYVLHHPVIVVTAFLTFTWGLALGVKYLIVSTIALLATLALYELCIRRINVMRWLFGMKLLQESRQESSPGSGPSPPLQH
jgi:glucans biosynthesis protein C